MNLGPQKTSPKNKKRPGFKESRDARTALPQNCSSRKIWHQAEERNATLERLNSTNGPRAKLPVRGNISNLQLVTSGCPRALGAVSAGLSFFSRREIRLPIANPKLLRFVVAISACRIERRGYD